MKTLVVYTSVSGNTKAIASEIADELDAVLLEVHSNAVRGSRGSVVSWGDERGLKSLPLEMEDDVDPSEFDLIILGTPILMWSPSPVIGAFLIQHPIKNKCAAVFSTSEGDIAKGLQRLTGALAGNRTLGSADFPDPRKDFERTKKRARSWARGIAERCEIP